MAVMLTLTLCSLTWAAQSILAAPHYGDLLGGAAWSPQEMEALLGQTRQNTQVQGPVQDFDFNTDELGLGTVSAVDVDSNGDLFIFHRADRPWNGRTFVGNALTPDAQVPIGQDTIVKVDPNDATLISSFGKDFFNVPHGLKVDNNDNLWVTDVGRHQVFRFPKNSTEPDLVLGEKFVPGSDGKHFCKPTDVAPASNGDFFVADGYCNSRVLKFSKEGKLLVTWGGPATYGQGLTPLTLKLVHSVTLIEDLDLVCVADRENERALCYNAGVTSDRAAGTFNRTLVPQGDMGKVFAIYYNAADNNVIAAGLTATLPYVQYGLEVYPPRAFTYNLAGVQTGEWAFMTPASARYGPSMIHDLCAARDGSHYFLADLYQGRVHRYNKGKQPVYRRGW